MAYVDPPPPPEPEEIAHQRLTWAPPLGPRCRGRNAVGDRCGLRPHAEHFDHAAAFPLETITYRWSDRATGTADEPGLPWHRPSLRAWINTLLGHRDGQARCRAVRARGHDGEHDGWQRWGRCELSDHDREIDHALEMGMLAAARWSTDWTARHR